MLDALTRCPKFIRRQSVCQAESSGRISSDEPRRTLDTPRTSSGSSAGSLFSQSGDSQQSGHSLRQTLVKFRQQRLRPLCIFSGKAEINWHRRASHSWGSIESIDDDQLQAVATSHRQPSNKRSSHLVPRTTLQCRGEPAVMLHAEHAQDLPSILKSFNSMPEFSLDMCSKDNSGMLTYNLESQHCGIGSRAKLMVKQEGDTPLDGEILDTLCTLRDTIHRVKESQKQSPKSSSLVKCESLPALGLTSTVDNNLSRTFSVPSRFFEPGSMSLGLINAHAPHSLLRPARLPTNQPSAIHAGHQSRPTCDFGLPNPGMIENEEDGDDSSSFCTLSDEEPDYRSLPHILPVWPSLPSTLRLPLIVKFNKTSY